MGCWSRLRIGTGFLQLALLFLCFYTQDLILPNNTTAQLVGPCSLQDANFSVKGLARRMPMFSIRQSLHFRRQSQLVVSFQDANWVGTKVARYLVRSGFIKANFKLEK
jgi:hypothetical protein